MWVVQLCRYLLATFSVHEPLLNEAGFLTVHEHLIIGEDGHASFRALKLM
jgi:hypothetical protein